MKILVGVILIILVLGGLTIWMGAPSIAPVQRPVVEGILQVHTTFYPTTYLSERIGGDLAEVTLPVPADADPIFWKPTPAAIQGYQKAHLVVINGASFEKWVEQVSLPSQSLVDTAAGFEKQFLKYEHQGVTHSHGPEGEHTHEGIDGHTWLDPKLAIEQARAIYEAMAQSLPQHEQQLLTNLQALEKDLQGLHEELAALQPPLMFASHPAYNYLAQRYGWKFVNLDLDPDAVPDSGQLTEIEGFLKSNPSKILLWEGTPSDAVAQLMSERFGFRNVVFSPCELLDEPGQDYLSVMKRNIADLRKALAP